MPVRCRRGAARSPGDWWAWITTFEGCPMWMSYVAEVDAVLEAAIEPGMGTTEGARTQSQRFGDEPLSLTRHPRFQSLHERTGDTETG
jgi:hypothetical protein